MRTFHVVTRAPAVKLLLAMLESLPLHAAYQLKLQRAVEPLLLALRLRVVRTRVEVLDAELHEPCAENGEVVMAV